MSTAEKSIDLLSPKKSLIDLSDPTQGFDSTLMGYSLSTLMEDVILVRYVDENDDGTALMRNGIMIPLNADTKASELIHLIKGGLFASSFSFSFSFSPLGWPSTVSGIVCNPASIRESCKLMLMELRSMLPRSGG